MLVHFKVLLLVVSLLAVKCDQSWNYHLWLDPNYSLKWNVDSEAESITFLCEVRTRGWVGLGLSPNGGMSGSDIVIGWVDDTTGETHFHDRYASGESVPQIDESQDWKLLASEQNSTHTILKFTRPLISCDKTHDRDITRDTSRVIYAYGDSDPKSASDVRMHGRHQRGGHSVLLLSHTESSKTEPKETDLQTLVLNFNNMVIPSKETTYWCKIFKVPRRKVHVVKFKPSITPGNEPFAHHITVSACFHPNPTQMEKHTTNEGADCTDSGNMPEDYRHCWNPYFMWAVGVDSFSLPEDVGFPLGDPDSDTYLLLNMHYDNPEQISGVVDSSGLELYYTQQYRKYEAYTLSVGAAMDTRMFVPPKQHEFHISAHCDTKCFQDVMDPNGLNVLAVWPHAHLLAKKIKTRHFRGNQELPWLEFDKNYDYNLQSFRTMDPVVNIKSGDQITVECEYDSSKRNQTVLGGYGTRDEMCNAFFIYYPKMMPSKPCFSALTPETARTLAGVKPYDNLTPSLTEYLAKKRDWNQTVLDRSHDIMLSARQTMQCYWVKADNDRDLEGGVGYPELISTYSPPLMQCKSPDQSRHFSTVVVVLSVAIALVVIIAITLVYIRKRRSRYTNRLT